MKAYKALDRNLKCQGMQYREGEVYEIEGPPVLCERGFHFCKELVLTLEYYPVEKSITKNKYAEVEILGTAIWEDVIAHKGVTNKLRVVRVLSDEEVLAMVDDKSNSGYCNSGHSNSGDRNSGNRNSGDRNSGNCNSGHSNSGDRNSGNCNSGDSNSGYWNIGHSNSGYWNSGDSNSGHWNSGNCNSGDSNSGHSNSGHRNSGNCNSGDSNSGHRNSGNCNSGHRNSGDRNSGNCNSGDSNSGDSNSGYRNSGNCNSGHSNSGNSNSGHRNSGHSNSGHWNSGDSNSGCFNTNTPEKIRVFNKDCLLSKWQSAYKPAFLMFEIDSEIGYKQSFKQSWEAADPDDRIRVKDLPNFDAETFFQISGIDLRNE